VDTVKVLAVRLQRVVVAIKETIRLMAELDKAIPNWPIE
jgi:hypothetical protein